MPSLITSTLFIVVCAMMFIQILSRLPPPNCGRDSENTDIYTHTYIYYHHYNNIIIIIIRMSVFCCRKNGLKPQLLICSLCFVAAATCSFKGSHTHTHSFTSSRVCTHIHISATSIKKYNTVRTCFIATNLRKFYNKEITF